jgi:hypothetical protein
MGIITTVVTVLTINEIIAGIQAQRQVSKRMKIYDDDLTWLDRVDNFTCTKYLDFMEQHQKAKPHLYSLTFIPPTFFFADEREKYIEKKRRLKHGRDKQKNRDYSFQRVLGRTHAEKEKVSSHQ